MRKNLRISIEFSMVGDDSDMDELKHEVMAKLQEQIDDETLEFYSTAEDEEEDFGLF